MLLILMTCRFLFIPHPCFQAKAGVEDAAGDVADWGAEPRAGDAAGEGADDWGGLRVADAHGCEERGGVAGDGGEGKGPTGNSACNHGRAKTRFT